MMIISFKEHQVWNFCHELDFGRSVLGYEPSYQRGSSRVELTKPLRYKLKEATSDAVKPWRLEKSGKMDRRLELGQKGPGSFLQYANEQKTRQRWREGSHASRLHLELHDMITS